MHASDRNKVIEDVCRHCDLAERLTFVPPSAKVRGLYFKSLESVLASAGKSARYGELFPESHATVLWHPASDFLVRLTVGGALLLGPERVHDGMFEIGRRNAVAFAGSLLGRTLLRLLSRDPTKLLQQAIAGRRQSYSYGRWDLDLATERTAVVTMTEEYLYIESYLLGAAQGTFEAAGVPVATEVKLDDRFNGRHLLKW